MSRGDIGYRVSLGEGHRAMLRKWSARMPPGPEAAAFGRAINHCIRLLQRDPVGWGDPLRQLRAAGLSVRRGLHEGILVEFGVDEARRIVYVADIRLAPWHPLYRGDT